MVDVNSELPHGFLKILEQNLTEQGLFTEEIQGVLLLLQLLPSNKEACPSPTVFLNGSIPPSSWGICTEFCSMGQILVTSLMPWGQAATQLCSPEFSMRDPGAEVSFQRVLSLSDGGNSWDLSM